MANDFRFTVSARDRFSKVFRSLNNEASRAMRPLIGMQRSSAMLFREMHLPQVARGFASASRAAGQLASGLGRVAGPLSMLTSIGGAGGLLAATAGVVAMGTAWANVGAEVNRTSKAIGVSAEELQRWRAIGKQAGLDEGDVTGGLSSAAMFAHRAQYGDPVASMLAAKLGLNVGSRGSPVSIDQLMPQLARVFSRIGNAQTRANLADAMGIGGLLPMLLGGPGQLSALGAKARTLGAIQGAGDLKGAQQLEDSANRFGIAAGGLRNRAASSIGPRLSKALDFFTEMMSPSAPGPAPSQEEADALKGRFRPFGGGRRGGAGQLDSLAEEFFRTRDPAVLERFNKTSKASGVESVIEVNVNAPPGSTVTATSNNPRTPVRVRHSQQSQGGQP